MKTDRKSDAIDYLIYAIYIVIIFWALFHWSGILLFWLFLATIALICYKIKRK